MKKILRAHLIIVVLVMFFTLVHFLSGAKINIDSLSISVLAISLLYAALTFASAYFFEVEVFDLEDSFVGLSYAGFALLFYLSVEMVTSNLWGLYAIIILGILFGLVRFISYAAGVVSKDTNENRLVCAVSKIPLVGVFVSLVKTL